MRDRKALQIEIIHLVERHEDITFGRHNDEEAVMPAINVSANPVNAQRARQMIETLRAA